MTEELNKQDFAVRSLPTRSVTLSPSRAEIIRDINDVTLKVMKSSHRIHFFV